jgi:predicted phage terminase large subunit-like protein
MRCEVVLPNLHRAQQQIVRERRRFNVPCLGRRVGKSTLCLSLLLDDPGWDALGAGFPVAWFAGTTKVFDEVWRLTLATLPSEVVRRTDTQKHRIELVTGGLIDFWTLDGGDRRGAGRGRKYRRAVIDEAAMVPDLIDVWSKAIRPTLVDLEGDAWFPSTPRGLLNDYYTLWRRGDPENKAREQEWASWRMPTSANPHLPRGELAGLEREYAGRPLDYRQEILAEFVEDQGQVFDLKWINELGMPKGWKPAHVYQAWDLAGTKQDLADSGCESVGVAVCKDWMSRWWLLDVVRGKWDGGGLIEQILSFGWKWRSEMVWLEDPVALWLESFLLQRQQQSGKHLPTKRVNVQGRGDKVARARAGVVPVMANGSFYVDPSAPWYQDARRDLAAFPAAGKDFTDALSLCLTEAMSMALPSPPPASAAGAQRDPRIITWDDLTTQQKTPRRNPWTR